MKRLYAPFQNNQVPLLPQRKAEAIHWNFCWCQWSHDWGHAVFCGCTFPFARHTTDSVLMPLEQRRGRPYSWHLACRCTGALCHTLLSLPTPSIQRNSLYCTAHALHQCPSWCFLTPHVKWQAWAARKLAGLVHPKTSIWGRCSLATLINFAVFSLT